MKNTKKSCVLFLCLLLCALAAFGCKQDSETSAVSGTGLTTQSGTSETDASQTTAASETSGTNGTGEVTEREWTNRH